MGYWPWDLFLPQNTTIGRLKYTSLPPSIQDSGACASQVTKRHRWLRFYFSVLPARLLSLAWSPCSVVQESIKTSQELFVLAVYVYIWESIGMETWLVSSSYEIDHLKTTTWHPASSSGSGAMVCISANTELFGAKSIRKSSRRDGLDWLRRSNGLGMFDKHSDIVTVLQEFLSQTWKKHLVSGCKPLRVARFREVLDPHLQCCLPVPFPTYHGQPQHSTRKDRL